MGTLVKDFLLKLVILPVFLSPFLLSAQTAKPNVVIILADDLGIGDIGAYNKRIPTPRIDSLAAHGVRFSDFYAMPVCTPSRYQLLTGCYSSRSLHELKSALMPGNNSYLDSALEISLSRRMSSIGYETALIGKWHLGDAQQAYHPYRHGFGLFTGLVGGGIDYWEHNYGVLYDDWWINSVKTAETGYVTQLLSVHAKSFLRKRANDREPFFLYLSFTAPHYGKTNAASNPPYTYAIGSVTSGNSNTLQAPLSYLQKFNTEKDSLTKYYSAMVSCLDDEVGSVVDFLTANGLMENTIIWFMSDNGGDPSYGGNNAPFRGGKHSVWEGGIRVPSIIVWKSMIPAGVVSSQIASNVDVVPTLAALLRFPTTGGLPVDGINLCANIFKGTTATRDLFWGNNKALRSGKWKLKDGALFNLSTDPGETKNLAATYPDTLAKLVSYFKADSAAIKNRQAVNSHSLLPDYAPNLTVVSGRPDPGPVERMGIIRTSAGYFASLSPDIIGLKIVDIQGRCRWTMRCLQALPTRQTALPSLTHGMYFLVATTATGTCSTRFTLF